MTQSGLLSNVVVPINYFYGFTSEIIPRAEVLLNYFCRFKFDINYSRFCFKFRMLLNIKIRKNKMVLKGFVHTRRQNCATYVCILVM